MLRLPTGLMLRVPFFSVCSEVFVSDCDIDWGGEAILCKFAEPNSVFIDVGANIGYYSLYMAPLVKSVWAFEPDPTVLQTLIENGERVKSVEIIGDAVSDRPGSLLFMAACPGSSGQITNSAEGALPLHATTLDLEWTKRGKPWVCAIKIDVEGYDFPVILGAEQLVAACAPLIFAELNHREDLERLFRWAAESAYTVFAHTRKRELDRTITLTQFDSVEELSSRFWKMLFLVPKRLLPEMQRIVA